MCVPTAMAFRSKGMSPLAFLRFSARGILYALIVQGGFGSLSEGCVSIVSQWSFGGREAILECASQEFLGVESGLLFLP